MSKHKPVLISFPRSGRNWLMILLGLSICYQRNLSENQAEVERKKVLDCTHDTSDKGRKLHFENLPKDKSKWADRKVILLIRDPRDITVSAFFHSTKRKKQYQGGKISGYIRDPRYGIEKTVVFYNNWYEEKHKVKDLMVLWYEDLEDDAVGSVERVCEFIRLECNRDCISEAVANGSIDKMREWERDKFFEGRSLGGRIKNPEDVDSFYHRKGKVGGFVDHLSPEDIQYVNEQALKMKFKR